MSKSIRSGGKVGKRRERKKKDRQYSGEKKRVKGGRPAGFYSNAALACCEGGVVLSKISGEIDSLC